MLQRVAAVILIGALVASCADGAESLTAEEATAEAEGLALEVARILDPDIAGIGRTFTFGCVEDIRDTGVETHITVTGLPTRALVTGPVVGILEERGYTDVVFGPVEPDSVVLKATGPDFTVELATGESTTDVIVITRGCTVDG